MVSDNVRASSLDSNLVRILLVDDTPIIVDRLSKALGAIDGVTIVGVSQDSTQAICDVARLSPTVIVLDIHLRSSNGWDVLQSAKRTNAKTLVFVFTNDNREEIRVQFMAGGADRFFDKSCEFGALHQTVLDLANVGGSSAMV